MPCSFPSLIGIIQDGGPKPLWEIGVGNGKSGRECERVGRNGKFLGVVRRNGEEWEILRVWRGGKYFRGQ